MACKRAKAGLRGGPPGPRLRRFNARLRRAFSAGGASSPTAPRVPSARFAAPRLRFAEGTRGAVGEEAEKGGGGRKGIGDKKIGISRFSLIFRGSAFGRMVGKKSEISRFSLIFETLQENQGLASR